jgi:hypothetical protein
MNKTPIFIVSLICSGCFETTKNSNSPSITNDVFNTDMPIALGSSFPIMVEGGIFSGHSAIRIKNPNVFAPMEEVDGWINAIGIGESTIQAINSMGEVVDEITLSVDQGVQFSLQNPKDISFNNDNLMPREFAVLVGAEIPMQSLLQNDEAVQLSHHNLVAIDDSSGESLHISMKDNDFVLTAPTIGDSTFTLSAGQDVYSRHEVAVVEDERIEEMHLSISVRQNDILQPQPIPAMNPDQHGLYWFLVVANIETDEGTPILGAEFSFNVKSSSEEFEVVESSDRIWIGIPEGESATFLAELNNFTVYEQIIVD